MTILRFLFANPCFFRIWGGGVYEDDAFFDICDELGLLVWLDFMFSCGTYPVNDPFLATVTAEVEDNVRRLRNHPSLVCWCGNNEDCQSAELYGASYDVHDMDPENWLKTTFPARYIYEKTLPELCAKLDPDTYYHPGSSWGGETYNDPTVGDTHMWEGSSILLELEGAL